MEIGGDSKNREWSRTESGNDKSEGKEIFRETGSRQLFEFSQDVDISPFSKTKLVAFSKPVEGDIPFTAIYELFPTGSKDSHSAYVLEKTLKKYGMDKKVVKTNKGTLLVHYERTIHVDGGHKIDIDIQTTKLPLYSFVKIIAVREEICYEFSSNLVSD